MNAVVLCAGFGTRLYPLTRQFPKPLLPVAGRPILEHLVDQLSATGHIEEILIVTNARFRSHFLRWRDEAAKRFRSDIWVIDDGATDNQHRLGAVRDLAFAVEHPKMGGPLLVAAGDNLWDFSFAAFFDDYFQTPRNLILAHAEADVERLRRTGVAETDSEGRLIRLWEKPQTPPTRLACPALYILLPEALKLLDVYLRETPAGDALGSFMAWLAGRVPVFTHLMKGRRLDVGNLGGYRTAESWLRREK